ncbi:cell division protein SepF [Methanosarcina hadiensis]|uniref:cell division protein SepF n=1 Tax=Methanosarcina hadiensis TaxID=3078083 RepID=UPI0039778FE2
MAKLIDKILGGNVKSSTTSAEDYTEIDLSKYEEVLEEEPAETYVKIAEISSINQVAALKQEIYNGNVLMVDISNIRGDDLLRDRVLKELKDVVVDVHGDIAGVKGNTVIVTPTGIKIDRSKIIGGKY